MLLNIMQGNFYDGIQIVQKAVSSKSTLPILKGIYLEADKEKGLRLIANNMEMGIEHWIKADIKKEGSIVIPATELTNIIRELPAAEIKIDADLEHYQVKIECLNSEFTLKGFQADEFPQLPEVEQAQKFVVKSEGFKETIDEIKFSVSTDQSQPALTGGLMIIKNDQIKLVGTNTYRLAYSQLSQTIDINEEINVILPSSTLNELTRLIENSDEIEILINNSYVRFTFNDIVFISRLIEGNFPNYKQVLPDNFKTEVTVDRSDLLKAVKRVSLIARLDSNVISLNVKQDKMHINSINSEVGDAHEILEIELDGPEQNIDIDASYLMDVLKVLSDDVVKIQLIGSLNPLTIKKENKDDFIYLIMPIRP